MRAREILQESDDYNNNLQSDLTNLLIGAKGSGATEVDTNAVVRRLYDMGYSVSNDSIVPLLSNNPVVMNATPEMITFSSGDGSMQNSEDPSDNSAEKVDKMAQDATDLG